MRAGKTRMVRATQPIEWQFADGRREYLEAGAEFELYDPARWSWSSMKAIGWDPDSTAGIPPRPVAVRRIRRTQRELMAQMEVFAAALAKHQGEQAKAQIAAIDNLREALAESRVGKIS